MAELSQAFLHLPQSPTSHFNLFCMADPVGEELDKIFASPHAPSAFATLNAVAMNIIASPDEAKFRRLKLSNKALQAKLLSVPGGQEIILALGFVLESGVSGEDALVLPPGQALPEELVARISQLLEAVGGPPPPPQAAQPASPAPSASGGSSFFSGMGLSPAERERRAQEAEAKRKAEAVEKARLVAEAEANQREREAKEKMMGGVKASIAKPLGQGQTVKL
jgi:hypothetical protein